jgi:hypothetical protein
MSIYYLVFLVTYSTNHFVVQCVIRVLVSLEIFHLSTVEMGNGNFYVHVESNNIANYNMEKKLMGCYCTWWALIWTISFVENKITI